jgi:hypothetical protein
MSNNEKKKVFCIMSNLPGSGKSTVGRAIEQIVVEKYQLTPYTINEFGLFGEWIDENPKLVKWSKTPDGVIADLTPEHYEAAFEHVAARMVEEFEIHSKHADILISEAARDIKGIGYLSLFSYLVDTIGDTTKFVNINVFVNDKEEVRRRVRERAKKIPMSASVAVVNSYIEDAPNYPHSTSTQAAAQFPDHFIYNGEINNSTSHDSEIIGNRIPENILLTVDGIMAQVIASQSR